MKHLVVLAALIGAFLILARYSMPWGVLLYDEADYVFAASRGFVTNATDRGSISTASFLHQGLTRGKDKGQKQSLSAEIRGRNDVLLYRHWHGPAYYYLLDLALHLSPGDETARYNAVRWWCAVVPILTLLVIYFGCLWITPGREGFLQAVLGSALFLLGTVPAMSLELAPHQMFVLFYIGSLVFLGKMLATRDRRYFYGAAMAAGFAFCTLEVTFVLIGTLLIVLFLERKWMRLDLGFLARAVATFLITVLATWPAGLLKLSFIKAFFIMAYIAVFRKAAWGNVTLGQTWALRFSWSPLEWALIALGVVLFLSGRQWKERERFVYPCLLFACLMIMATLRVVTDIPRYALVFLPALDVFAGCTVGAALSKQSNLRAYGAVAAVCCGLFAINFVARVKHPYDEEADFRSAIECVQKNGLQQRTLLVPTGMVPVLHLYFPLTHLWSYEGAEPTSSEMDGRHYDGVLSSTNPVHFRPLAPNPLGQDAHK